MRLASLVLPEDWRALRAAGTGQVVIAAVTLAVVVAVGVLEALIAAVVLSMLDVIARSARPHDAVLGWVPRMGRYADVSVHLSARVTPGVVVYRLDDRLFFANARYFSARVREAIAGAPTPTRWLVFDAQFVTDVDASGAEALEQLCKQLAERGVTFVVARLADPTKARFDATGLTDLIGQEHFYPTVEAAVRACVAADDGRTADTRQAGSRRDGRLRRGAGLTWSSPRDRPGVRARDPHATRRGATRHRGRTRGDDRRHRAVGVRHPGGLLAANEAGRHDRSFRA